ncbi:MAG: CHASE3 domain-containing protein [Proteobacteria bacterium]|nr:CHASE3 domain-containing protein [Pseudomonadota bacterium]
MVGLNISRRLTRFFTWNATRTLLIWIVIAVLSGMTAIVAWQWMVKSAEEVTHTQLVQQELTKWLSATQDLENGQLGYLLTRDASYLKPYQSAKGAVSLIHNNLVRLVGSNVGQIAVIESIHQTIKERLEVLDNNIAALDNGNSVSPMELGGQELGGKIMERLRSQIAAAKQQEQMLYRRELKKFHLQSSWLLAAMLGTLLACAALALVAMIRERQRVAALEVTALTLASANRSLEQRVASRTEELAIERDRAEAERERAEALLRDVTHRIGNTLSLVVGFINLHIRHTTDPKSLKTLIGARDRIHAIASAQRRINVVNDLELVRIDTLIRAVLDDVVEAAGEDRIQLTVDVPPLLASAQVATSLCVLTQEFVVNSFKHAFGETGAGRVDVLLRRKGDSGAELVVEDDGVGIGGGGSVASSADHEGQSQHAEGLGTKIAALLTRQFAGTISYQTMRPGTDKPGTRVIVTLSDLALSDPDQITAPQHEEHSPPV